MQKILIAAAAVALLSGPLAAAASLPSYARPSSGQTIGGRIVSINSRYNISVRDGRTGYVDSVELHQGTIINPTGLTLRAGMGVTILGYGAGRVFNANEIDTAYRNYANYAPVYYGPGWWYPRYRFGFGGRFGWW